MSNPMSNPLPAAGPEVVDLNAELHMTDDEASSWLDVEPTVVTPDLARLTGFSPDYVMATWLAAVLRGADVPVVTYPGWKHRGRPRTAGPFVPEAVMWHHDASAKGPSPSFARFIAQEGRPPGIPAPLSQLWVCMGCNGRHPVGTWHVLAAGRANHAGEGNGFGVIGRDRGNTQSLGVETDNTTGEPTPWPMYESLVTGTAAILRHLRADAKDALCGHKEYAAGRKVDPDDIDMHQARADVAVQLRRPLKPYPGPGHFKVGHQCSKSRSVKQLENWLLELPTNAKSRHEAGATATKWTIDRVKAFQNAHNLAGEGQVTAETWRLIQVKARSAR